MILVNETKAFLDKHINNAGDPFFAYVPIGNAHIPHSPPDKFLDGTNVAGSYGTRHMDILYEMDKVVGALIEALTDRQLLEDTIIIFTSDNGGLGQFTNSDKFGHLSSGQLRGSKGQVYEGGIRVPFIAHWQGEFGKPRQEDVPVIGVDLLPTLLELAGGKPSKKQQVDGESIVGVLTHENQELEDRAIYWHFPAYLERYRGLPEEGPFRTTPATAIRSGKWKLIRFYESGREELYDLDEDISESENLSAAYPDLVKKLSGQLDRWLADTNAFIPSMLNPDYAGVESD